MRNSNGLIIAPLVGQIADCLTTLIGLMVGHYEGNPMASALLETHPALLVGVKIAIGALLMPLLMYVRERDSRLFTILAWGFTIAGFGPALWNVVVILVGG